MNNIVFTLSGKGNCGKDSVGKLIQKAVAEKEKLSFSLAYADWLKALCTRNFMYDDTRKEECRHILQNFGEKVREDEEDFWTHIVFQTIDRLSNLYDVFVITDARYENELKPYPWRLGYPIFNVYIKNDNFKSHLGEQEQQHISEQMANNPDLDKFHFIVDNSGTLDETYEQVKEMVDLVFKAQEEELEKQRCVMTDLEQLAEELANDNESE